MRKSVLLLVVTCSVLWLSCDSMEILDRRFVLPSAPGFISRREPLKAHMKNGEVYLMNTWMIDSSSKRISGFGYRYSPSRAVLDNGELSLPTDSAVLYEINSAELPSAMKGFAIVGVANLAVLIYCLANPKACYGSCPTFYADVNGKPSLRAEAFSASIAPSLEETDVDDLGMIRVGDTTFRLTMKNEALETHVVKRVDLLAAPVHEGCRVFRSGSSFIETGTLTKPRSATTEGRSVLTSLIEEDGREFFSLTDSTDLNKKEEVILDFPRTSGKQALVVSCRQSLLSTYLFYQGLAYMGTEAGYFYAALERNDGNMRAKLDAFRKTLGGIEVHSEDSKGNWTKVGEIGEMGPIAKDIHLVDMGTVAPRRVKLRMTRGAYRIDWAALVEVKGNVLPIRLQPVSIRSTSSGMPRSVSATITTMPGEEYDISYTMPRQHRKYQLFVEATGYYLEWMREQWLEEEDVESAVSMFADPKKSLRSLAASYKKQEAGMESAFWGSKYAKMR